MRGIGSWVVAGLLLIACGDDGENGRDDGENGRDGGENERDDLEDAGLDAEELRQMAVQKCDDLVEKFCTRVSSCAEAEDLLDESYPAAELNMDCRAAIGEALPCETAVAVGDGYAKCLMDVENYDCEVSNEALLPPSSAFADPPASCKMQILFPPK